MHIDWKLLKDLWSALCSRHYQREAITLRDRVRNKEIREQTKVTDIIEQFARLKWQWVGHVARQNRNKWSIKTTLWRPRTTKRNVGRPQKR